MEVGVEPRLSRGRAHLHFDRFDGFIFEAEKPFENVCATEASPVGQSISLRSCLARKDKLKNPVAYTFSKVFGLEDEPVKSVKMKVDV